MKALTAAAVKSEGKAPREAAQATTAARGRDVLNLGCGRVRVEEAVNVDVTPLTGPDVLHDLDRRPWPFADDSFDEVLAYDVVEHLEDVVAAFEEIHRVARDGAVVRVSVPHFSSGNAFNDPTHRHFFGYHTLDCFTEGHEHSFYTHARFRYRHRQIIFWPTLLNKAVWRLANRWPMGYELRWAWVFPALFVSLELEVVKGRGGSG
ncbi:MAG TPA: methyltransferase domain-containing protein [Pyrinomonadaceae bacterium]|jgi:SAM-dependent methyltransferase